MDDNGNILNFYKQLTVAENSKQKNIVMKLLLRYILDTTLSNKDYSLLFKLIKDFGYEIVFDSLVIASYANITYDGFWPYVIKVCKELMYKMVQEDTVQDLSNILEQLELFDISNFSTREKILGELYE